MNRRTLLRGIAAGAAVPAAAQNRVTPKRAIRLISIAPSPYTRRYDSLRAGYAIKSLLDTHIKQHGLAFEAQLFDGARRLAKRQDAQKLLEGRPAILAIGSSTWAQGSSRFVREFFEVVSSVSLVGVNATCWVTSGGAHTGGEVTAYDIQRSLQGLGASVFTLGQKQMVLTTDEREAGLPGVFTTLDMWFLDQFARMMLMTAASLAPTGAGDLQSKLDFNIDYYRRFPIRNESLPPFLPELRDHVNAASRASSPERGAMMAAVL